MRTPGNEELGTMAENNPLTVGAHDCLHILDAVVDGIWRRSNRECGGTVYGDPVLKRNQNVYHSSVRGVKPRGMLSAIVSPLEHAGMFVVRKSSGGLRLILDGCQSIKLAVSAPWCATAVF